MSSYPRLALASLAAAVALAAAACTPATTNTSGTSGTSGNSTSGSAAISTPESSNGPSPQASGAYPLAPGGVTYNGEGGAVETFSIAAGSYSLNQQATYDPSKDPDGTDECLFGGELDYVPAGSSGVIPLGDNGAPVTDAVPLDGQSAAPYPGGDYRLYIYPTTTCSWTIELWPSG